MARPKTDKEMILDPNSWPKWPLLPLVIRGSKPQTGIIIGDPTVEGKVFFLPNANLFLNTPVDTKKGMLIDVDELLAQGWVVD